MNEPHVSSHRSWAVKFRDAFRGVWVGVRGSRSFHVHFPAAAAVIAAGSAVHVDAIEWCILCGSIAMVMAAELFNSALESLAKAVSQQPHPRLRDALDVSSGAVLVAAIAAAIIGAVVLLHRIGCQVGW